MAEKTYPLAPRGLFATVQGEGTLLGEPMLFLRLAGCSVGCDHCDTDYRVHRRLTLSELAGEVRDLGCKARWAWVTGGEPTDHDLPPLVALLRDAGYRVALATAGIRPVRTGFVWGGLDYVSVSPHALDDSWVLRRGDQVNLVPGLGPLTLGGVAAADDLGKFSGFPHRYLTPAADREGRPTNLEECVAFVTSRPGWRLGVQAHKTWGIP